MSDVEETADFRGVEEDFAVLDFDWQGPEMRTFARTADTEAVVGLISRAMGRAHQVSTIGVPQLSGLAIIKLHRQVPAFVLVGPHFAIVQPQEDALLIEWSIAVGESETFGRDLVESCDTFHEENHINLRQPEETFRVSVEAEDS